MRTLVTAALALLLAAQAPAPTRVDDLAWMSGSWESANGERWLEETWSAPRAGMMLGFARHGVGERLHEFEFVRLQAGEDGVVTYFAQPQGRPAVPFRLARAEANEAVFENPDHDYPQRIRYRRDGDSLTATISRLDGSHAIDFAFRRR